MGTLTLKTSNPEFKALPYFLRDFSGYLTSVEGKSDKTTIEYLLDLRTFFRYTVMIEADEEISAEDFEKISIQHLTEDDVKRVRRQTVVNFLAYTKTERNNNATTRNRKLSSLKSFFKYMHNNNFIDRNPVADFGGIQKSKTLSKYLTLEEAILLLETVNSDLESKTRVRDYSIIALFLNTGMRLSELVGLNLEDFDRELSFVKVRGKGNKERIIYLNNAARDAVKSYLSIRLDPRYIRTSDRALYLSGRQQRISNKTVQWVVYKYLDLSGLGYKGYSVHKLRHTAATLMYQSGKVDIRVLKDVLGHEQLNTTQIYTHLVNRNLEEAMQNHPLSDTIVRKKQE